MEKKWERNWEGERKSEKVGERKGREEDRRRKCKGPKERKETVERRERQEATTV